MRFAVCKAIKKVFLYLGKCFCFPCTCSWNITVLIWRKIPWEKKIVPHMVTLYLATFFIILPLLCHNMKNSLYFTKSIILQEKAKEDMRIINTERLNNALKFLESTHKNNGYELIEDTQNIDVAISIVTVSRNRHKIDSYEPKYLTQVVAKLMDLAIKAKESRYAYNFYIEICNVDFDPMSYQEAKNLSKYLPMINRFNKTFFSEDHPLEKEKQDYVYCLTKAMEHKPRYALILEDDALPNEDLFSVLSHTIYHHLDHDFKRGELIENKDNVLYVKLYHPERLVGFFSLEIERIPEWIAYSMLLATILTIIYTSLRNAEFSIKWVFFLFFIYSFLSLCIIGRANLNEMRRFMSPMFYSYGPAPSCCTPAMLFPQNGAKKTIDYLSSIKCKARFGKDTALESLVYTSKDPVWKAFLVQPNSVTHIGMYSALRVGLVDPFNV